MRTLRLSSGSLRSHTLADVPSRVVSVTRLVAWVTKAPSSGLLMAENTRSRLLPALPCDALSSNVVPMTWYNPLGSSVRASQNCIRPRACCVWICRQPKLDSASTIVSPALGEFLSSTVTIRSP